MTLTNKQQLEIVGDAKRRVLNPQFVDDIETAVGLIRDLPATKETGNRDLVWAMHKYKNVHRNDILPTLKELERYLTAEDEKGGSVNIE